MDPLLFIICPPRALLLESSVSTPHDTFFPHSRLHDSQMQHHKENNTSSESGKASSILRQAKMAFSRICSSLSLFKVNLRLWKLMLTYSSSICELHYHEQWNNDTLRWLKGCDYMKWLVKRLEFCTFLVIPSWSDEFLLLRWIYPSLKTILSLALWAGINSIDWVTIVYTCGNTRKSRTVRNIFSWHDCDGEWVWSTCHRGYRDFVEYVACSALYLADACGWLTLKNLIKLQQLYHLWFVRSPAHYWGSKIFSLRFAQQLVDRAAHSSPIGFQKLFCGTAINSLSNGSDWMRLVP